MISFAMPARNSRDWTIWALTSLHNAIHRLNWKDQTEVLLMDDASDPSLGVQGAFADFRRQSGVPTRIVRFTEQQHYSRVLAAAVSLCTGDKIFFLSNDMVFSPAFFKTLFDVSNLDPTIGIVRGTSNYVDSLPEHIVHPPFPLRSMDDIQNFSLYVSIYWQHQFVEDPVLSGDAIVINRSLIDKIGYPDPRYFGYFGDVDYGLRANRAGFKLVCAKGAWLLHHGGGYVKDEAQRSGQELTEHHIKRLAVVQTAYELFRDKWDRTLPEKCDTALQALSQLKAIQPIDRHQYHGPRTFTADQIEHL